MKESRYELIIFWDKSDQIFVVDVPELPGCMAHGRTKSAAIANAEAAIELWIETAKQDGLPVPEPRGRLMFARNRVSTSSKAQIPDPSGASNEE